MQHSFMVFSLVESQIPFGQTIKLLKDKHVANETNLKDHSTTPSESAKLQ
jgi:hypothetical protein